MLRGYAKVLPKWAPDFSDKGVVGFWWNQAQSVDPTRFEVVLSHLVASCDSFPTLGQIKMALGIWEVPLMQVAEAPKKKLADEEPEGPKKPLNGKRVHSTAEAAALLGIKKQTLASWRIEKKGPPFHKIGNKKVGYLIEDIDAWIDEQKRHSTVEYATRAKHLKKQRPPEISEPRVH